MYESTRSYLSRFSGAILFILALIIVGVLIFLTVRSAQDDTDTSSSNTGTSSVVSAEDDSDVFGTIDSDTGVVTVDDSAVSSSQVQVIASRDDDEVATNGAESSTSNGQAIVTGSLSAQGDSALPNTGPAEIAAVTIGLTVVSLSFVGFIDSRRNLNNKLLKF